MHKCNYYTPYCNLQKSYLRKINIRKAQKLLFTSCKSVNFKNYEPRANKNATGGFASAHICKNLP